MKLSDCLVRRKSKKYRCYCGRWYFDLIERQSRHFSFVISSNYPACYGEPAGFLFILFDPCCEKVKGLIAG